MTNPLRQLYANILELGRKLGELEGTVDDYWDTQEYVYLIHQVEKAEKLFFMAFQDTVGDTFDNTVETIHSIGDRF